MFSPSRIVPRIIGVACGLAVLACVLACGATAKVREAQERIKRANELSMVGIAYQNYLNTKGTFPPDQKALLDFAQNTDPEVARIVQSGQYTFHFAPVKVADLTEGSGNVVLGYENAASPQGRLVLTADGAVRMMPDAEFNGKPKLPAKKK